MAGTRENQNLTPKQAKCIEVLLVAEGHAEAAELAGVSDRTLRRWLHWPPFVEGLRAAQRAAFDAAIARLQPVEDTADDRLGEVEQALNWGADGIGGPELVYW